MDKKIIFSHESDIDGLGCIILAKLAFDVVDYQLLPNIGKLEETFRDYFKSKKLEDYSEIFVTDLALYDPALTMVAESPLKEKVFVFDHHKKAIDDNMNRYTFTKIVEEDENGKRCGTELFYEYLKQNHFINTTKAIEEFVELTRLEDTWDWKKAGFMGQKAHDLAILFNVLGIEEYISKVLSKLSNNSETFELNEEERNLIQMKKKEYDNLLKSILSNAEYFLDENENKYGVVFADYEYRNELTEFIRNNNNPENVKYFIFIALEKGESGQKSYRSIKEGFDVQEVASSHGGGGHPDAAGVSITKEQKLTSQSLPKREALKYLAESKY